MADSLRTAGQASPETASQGAASACEITPEMIEAGVAELVKWESSSDPYSANCVVAVYRAMAAATRKSDL